MDDMFCSQSPNATIGNTSITWAQAEVNAINNLSTVSYLRPDTGGALLPWIYTIVVIIVHLPVVVIRVVRWQAMQYFCLASTFFTVVVYTQAYVSTRFDAAKVLVWTPLILVIDAGSMLQVFFLIIEAKKESVEDQAERCAHCMQSQDHKGPSIQGGENTPNFAGSHGSSDLLAHCPACKVQIAVVQRPLSTKIQHDSVRSYNTAPRGLLSCSATSDADENLCWYRNPSNYAAAIAALLFITVLVLQLLGLVKAAQAANASSNSPLVSWCSPLFQPFGIAAVDGSCNIYHISQSDTEGIGCITLPGQWQQQWLKGTIAGISIELFTELIDLLILSLVNGKRKIFQAVKMKRPWATIFSGLIILIITLIYGVNYSLYLPPGVTERVTVLIDAQGPASYTGNLRSAGLRGTIIGWNDGLFESWKATYFGGWSP